MQMLRGFPEVEVFRDGDEVANVTQFHGRYSIPAEQGARKLFRSSWQQGFAGFTSSWVIRSARKKTGAWSADLASPAT